MNVWSHLRQQLDRMRERSAQRQAAPSCTPINEKQLACMLAKLSDAELRKHTDTLLRFYGIRRRDR